MPPAEDKRVRVSLCPRTSVRVGTCTQREKRREERRGKRADNQVKLRGMREQLGFHSEQHESHWKVGEEKPHLASILVPIVLVSVLCLGCGRILEKVGYLYGDH